LWILIYSLHVFSVFILCICGFSIILCITFSTLVYSHLFSMLDYSLRLVYSHLFSTLVYSLCFVDSHLFSPVLCQFSFMDSHYSLRFILLIPMILPFLRRNFILGISNCMLRLMLRFSNSKLINLCSTLYSATTILFFNAQRFLCLYLHSFYFIIYARFLKEGLRFLIDGCAFPFLCHVFCQCWVV